MRIHLYWDGKALQQIASDCGNKQLLKDVAFGRFLFYHQKQKLFCEWTDDSFCIGKFNNNHFLIVGLGTRMRARKKGLASMHLKRVINAAIMGGVKTIRTRTYTGTDFYLKKGFQIVGLKGDEYIMEKYL